MTTASEIGRVEAIFRYPVKSMRGEPLESAELGWHGVEGDRRLGVRRLGERGGFPWLTASKLAELVRYAPAGDGESIVTPEGEALPTFGEALAADLGRRHGAPVELMKLKHGIFDDACVSVIAADTVAEIARQSGTPADVRRFRPNIVVRTTRALPFEEDGWVGGVLQLGDAAIAVTLHDVRCAMVNIDPDDASLNHEVLKAVVRSNRNNAGVYGTVTRAGRIAVGQAVTFAPSGAASR